MVTRRSFVAAVMALLAACKQIHRSIVAPDDVEFGFDYAVVTEEFNDVRSTVQEG